MPSKCLFFDTETLDESIDDESKALRLRLGCAVFHSRTPRHVWSKGEWYNFTAAEVEGFWDWVCSKVTPSKRLYMFAHNLVFDMTTSGAIEQLRKRGYKLEKAIVDDPPSIFHFTMRKRKLRKDKQGRKRTKTIVMLDTFNYFHVSVAELGDSIGIPKMTMPPFEAPDSVWYPYCQRDVEVIAKVMQIFMTFLKDNDLGNFASTIASQAFSAYRHRFMSHSILIDDDEESHLMARAAYHGGRTEAFYIGEATGSFHLLDINSMYPYVMRSNDYPRWFLRRYDTCSIKGLGQLLERFCCVAEVRLKTDRPVYGVVHTEKLLFGVGQLETTLCTGLLKYALEHGDIVSVGRVVVYQKANLFADFVDTLYALRQQYAREHNDSFKTMAKYVLNTLYGKFGQTGRVFETVETTDDMSIKSYEVWDAEKQELARYRQFGGIIQREARGGESFNSFAAIAAHVTEYSRLYLWELIEKAGTENVYYCDTDSLVVNDPGRERLAFLIDPSRLGALKLERSFSYLSIRTAKDYKFGDVEKIKGVRKNARQLEPNVFEQERFRKFKGMVAKGDLSAMIVSKVVKHLRRTYDKGTVTETGRVVPLLLDMWKDIA